MSFELLCSIITYITVWFSTVVITVLYIRLAWSNKINKADKKLSYDIYMSYHDDLKDYLGERFSSKLYLADCPLDLRVSYEEVWGKFSVEFCDGGEMTEKVEPLRKEFQ